MTSPFERVEMQLGTRERVQWIAGSARARATEFEGRNRASRTEAKTGRNQASERRREEMVWVFWWPR